MKKLLLISALFLTACHLTACQPMNQDAAMYQNTALLNALNTFQNVAAARAKSNADIEQQREWTKQVEAMHKH